MRVAAVQMKARATWDESLRVLDAGIAAADGARLIVAPEMALRGYDLPDRAAALRVAEPADGPTAAAVGAWARRQRAWVVVGLPEQDGERLYNSALVLGPDGALVAVYRKSLLFEADEPWASPGDGRYPVVDTGDGRFAVGICMDLNDDRFLAVCAQEQVDAIAFPTNWIQEEPNEVHPTWQARLAAGWPSLYTGLPGVIPGRAPVRAALVAANSYGREGAYRLAGRSAILSLAGLHAVAPPDVDAVVLADVGRDSR